MSTTLKKPVRRKAASKNAPASGGIVSAQIRGSKSRTLEFTSRQLIEFINAGLTVRELEELQVSLDVPMDQLAPRLGISIATIQRRKQQGRLEPAESDRVLRFARLMGKAVAVFGNEDDARRWLSSPQFGLGGALPLDYAKTELGAREVENLLGRIEYGVYS